MIVIHGVNEPLEPRFATETLARHLQAMPVVVVTGARQTGKSTLAAHLAPGPRNFWSLDDMAILDLARRSPADLLDGGIPVVLDEVQRAPELLLAVKREVDRERIPGRFLLTGSANLLLMQEVSESLAGRASWLQLWPMTRREQRGLGSAGRWEELLAASEKSCRKSCVQTRTSRRTGGRWRFAAAFRYPPSG